MPKRRSRRLARASAPKESPKTGSTKTAEKSDPEDLDWSPGSGTEEPRVQRRARPRRRTAAPKESPKATTSKSAQKSDNEDSDQSPGRGTDTLEPKMQRRTRPLRGTAARKESLKAGTSKIDETSDAEDSDQSPGRGTDTLEPKMQRCTRPRPETAAANEVTKEKIAETDEDESDSSVESFRNGAKTSDSEPGSISSLGSKNVKKADGKLDMSVGKVTEVEDADDQYYVEKILDYKIEKGKEFFLVKWLYWPDEYNNWEPVENVQGCDKARKCFFKKNPGALRKHKKFMVKAQNEATSTTPEINESPEPGHSGDRVPQLPMASIIIGESLYSYIPEVIIEDLPVKVPHEIIGREPGVIHGSDGDTAILVLWYHYDDELRVVLESVARKYFPDKFNEFLESEIADRVQEMGINGLVREE